MVRSSSTVDVDYQPTMSRSVELTRVDVCSGTRVISSPVQSTTSSAALIDIPSDAAIAAHTAHTASVPPAAVSQQSPLPNFRHPNVDLQHLPAAAPRSAHCHSSDTKPWLQRYTRRRWDLLFGAYRRVDFAGLHGFAVVEVVAIALYCLVNLIICVAGIAQMISIGSSDTATLKSIGNNFGIYGTVNVVILLFPVTRSSTWQYILGISFERAIWYHKWIARVAVAELAIHGGCVYAASYYNGTLHSDALDNGILGEYASGSISFFIAVAIVVQSLYFFRRLLHEWFLRLHIILFIAFLVFGFVHEPTVRIVLIALVLYVFDWVLRLTMWRRPVTVVGCSLLPGNVTRLSFQMKDLLFQPGQYVMICLPLISPFEWHPYTLSGSPYEPILTIHSKACGGWSRRLEEIASDPTLNAGQLKMYVEGPYGNIGLPLDRMDHFLLVAGGIGVTPLGSLYHSLCYEHWLGARTIRLMRLVWVMRDPALVSSIYPETDSDPTHHFLHSSALRAAEASVLQRQSAQHCDGQPVSLVDRVSTTFHSTQRSLSSGGNDDSRVSARASASWLLRGRPSLRREFEAIKEMVDNEDHKDGAVAKKRAVAVLVCGPQQMVEQVRLLCAKQSSATVAFMLHEETFVW